MKLGENVISITGKFYASDVEQPEEAIIEENKMAQYKGKQFGFFITTSKPPFREHKNDPSYLHESMDLRYCLVFLTILT